MDLRQQELGVGRALGVGGNRGPGHRQRLVRLLFYQQQTAFQHQRNPAVRLALQQFVEDRVGLGTPARRVVDGGQPRFRERVTLLGRGELVENRGRVFGPVRARVVIGKGEQGGGILALVRQRPQRQFGFGRSPAFHVQLRKVAVDLHASRVEGQRFLEHHFGFTRPPLRSIEMRQGHPGLDLDRRRTINR